MKIAHEVQNKNTHKLKFKKRK